jgi:hypothetical protein
MERERQSRSPDGGRTGPVWLVVLGVIIAACSRDAAPPAPSRRITDVLPPTSSPATSAAALAQPCPGCEPVPVPAPIMPALPAQMDPDGNDDPEDPGGGIVPGAMRFERVGRAPLALQRICDLTPFQGALYAAHANQPLGTDGATITRYVPPDPDAAADGDAGPVGLRTQGARARPFSVAFDWNRPGEPTEGGGAGQGFLRVHAIGGRLFVPDSDPPYNGFGISEGGTEGFVFVSDAQGKLARAQGPHLRPPPPPSADGGAGAAVLPRAYHVLDVIRFRGRLYASTGSVPPKEHAWRGPSPGALHVSNASLSRWTYEVGYPFPYKDGVWRLGYMVRFEDRLFAGIQDYDGRELNDYVVFDPPADSTAIAQEDLHPERVTERGGALTLRWYADRGNLYWIALERDGAGKLRVRGRGEPWREIALPPELGRPTDIVRFRDGLVVLAERGLARIDREAVEILAAIEGKKSPFEITDAFCSAPLGVLGGELYAGGQRDGGLYRIVPAVP